MGAASAIIGGASLLFSMGQAGKANAAARAGRRMADAQFQEQLAFQKEQQALLEKQKEQYRQMEFVNPYEGIQNVYEDLTVSQEAAQFQAEQGTQQRANILSNLRGTAGASGIAGLAQALAGQGTLQARQISTDLARQETANQALAAKGASAADMARRGGEAMIQEAEMSRQATLLGMQFGGAAGANQGVQQAFANQMSAQMATSQMQMQQAGMFSNMASSFAGMDFGGGGGGANNYYGGGTGGGGGEIVHGQTLSRACG